MIARKLVIVAAAVLSGCAGVPPTNVHQPMSARPAPVVQPPEANGAIFQAATNRLVLFEDRRARHVGDTLVVNIIERDSVSKTASATAERTTSMSASIPTPTILGYQPAPLPIGVPGMNRVVDPTTGLTSYDTTVTDSSGEHSFEGKGDSSQRSNFTGTIAVTVIDVFPNGNLLVSGEKMLGTNDGNEYVRFSGVVSPWTINAANTVNSTQIADARLEFKGNSTMSTAQTMGWLAKFFLSVLPF